jgi:uncharacterized membrane protein
MASKGRLAFIDLLRGWAVLVMIEVHVFNQFILPATKNTTWYHALNYINGWVAPSFIFISGFVFLLASSKKLEQYRQYGTAFWKQLGRIALIWLTGYMLHLPFFSLHRTLTETTELGWLKSYQVDVLHCIAFGLLLLFLLRLAIRSASTYRTVLLALGLSVVAVTPFLWTTDFVPILSAPLAAYVNGLHYSLFPLFPWIGFMLFGGYMASGYIDAREAGKEREYILHAALVASFLFAFGIVLHAAPLPPLPAYLTMEIRANPFFFFERLGIVMLLLAVCWWYADWRKTERSFVLDAGKESFLVYTAHLMAIYGQFWNDHSLAFRLGKTAGVWECAAGTVVLALCMIAAAKLWSWLKQTHGILARGFFWVFVITTCLMYLQR